MNNEIQTAILTISDRSSRGERPDLSGPALVNYCESRGWSIVEVAVVPDEIDQISAILIDWCNRLSPDIILTTGGTGFAPRDVTPEATLAVIEKAAPGLAEAMRLESLKITPHAMLSRAIAGIRGKTLILNLPGSPKAAIENLGFVFSVLPHAIQLLHEDTSAESGHSFQTPREI